MIFFNVPLNFCLGQNEVIVSEDNSYTRLIECLHLYESDRIAILNGKELSDTVINAAPVPFELSVF